MTQPRIAISLALTLFVLAGCTSEQDEPAAPASSPEPTEPSAAPTPEPEPEPGTLPAAFGDPVEGGDLREVGRATDLGPYTRQEVRYRSDDLTISGVLFVPDGEGPHPAVVLNHGYIDPDAYVTGQGMPREQDLLARRGWVVLHTDYRGHAGSDDVSGLEHELRVGYARDAIAAVQALRERPDVDPSRVGMFGRSMGGGVTQAALTIEPDIVDRAVVHASVSSRFADNVRRWTEQERPRRLARLEERFGSIEDDPAAWDDLSPRSHFDRIDAEILAIHGEQDESCPVRWARQTDAALEDAGVEAELVEFPGEGHTFAAGWEDAMDRTIEHLSGG